MNVFRKTLCLMLSIMFVCLVAGGCGGDDSGGGKKVDPNKTQIYVGITSQGINEKWIDPVIERFEAKYTEYQVFVDPLIDKEQSDADFAKNMPTSRDDLFFLQGGNCPTDWIDSGYIEDITDVVTEGHADFDEGKTIESKIMDDFKDKFRLDVDGEDKYYFIPYVLSISGVVYDADLFREKALFNLNGYKGLDCIDGNSDDTYGPDGLADTFDDGLPATWEDFKVMMRSMTQKGVTPFLWSGQHSSYRSSFAKSLLANYYGADQYSLFYEMQGFDDELQTEITYKNGWKLATKNGKKAVLQAISDICTNTNNFAPESYYQSTSHLQAQNLFLLSCQTNKSIAMLTEGGWWENEAKDTFKEMERFNTADRQYGYGQRDFRYMPMPKFIGTEGVVDQTNTKTVLHSDFSGSTVCLNKASKNKEIAKLFLRFCHTDQSLRDFTTDNGLIRPYKYEFEADEFTKLSKYAQSVWNAVYSENTEIADGSILTKLGKVYSDVSAGLLLSSYVNKSYSDPFAAFFSDANRLTVEQYYSGMGTLFTEEKWNAKLPD